MQQSIRELIAAGWLHDPEAVSQFVRRALTDFRGDPAATQLINNNAHKKFWSKDIPK